MYEPVAAGGFKRISCFDSDESSSLVKRTVNVLYAGGMHYDALIIPGADGAQAEEAEEL